MLLSLPSKEIIENVADRQQFEQFENSSILITGATGVVSHDYAVSAIFHHSSMVASFTCNLTNIPTTTSRTIIVALVLIQGTTAYMCTALQIAGVAQTIRWANGIVPTGTASKTDIVTFTLIRASSAWTVLGQNQVYG